MATEIWKTYEKRTAMMELLKKNEGQSTSTKIRALSAAGYPRARIADCLGLRYQHVRNVLESPLKKKGELKV